MFLMFVDIYISTKVKYDNIIQHIKALIGLNTALFTELETALYIVDEWDNMLDQKREKIITSLKPIIENNRTCFKKTNLQ